MEQRSIPLSYQQSVDGVIPLLDRILEKAVLDGASDIHFETEARGLRVRYRIDGVLHDEPFVTSEFATAVLTRLKLLAHMSIAHQRVPSDGTLRITSPRPVDLRIATFPCVQGEQIAVRLLDRHAQPLQLDSLGFSEIITTDLRKLAARASGFLLVTGPTGSGKTTTLYALLSELATPDRHIVTLEDPVEYYAPGIAQAQVNPEAGFTFARGLRALLRQDPDIALIGEIRDYETAKIAIEAALTGHLLVSTLHTTSAPGALIRLIDMGIEPFLINASITGIMTQRLVRLLCKECAYPEAVSDEQKIFFKQHGFSVPEYTYRATGCQTCHGREFKGRKAVSELLIMTDALRSLLVQRPLFAALHAQAVADGMQPLRNVLYEALCTGSIAISEMIRLTL